MSDAALTVEMLPLEERGWRLAVLQELVLFCLSTARVIFRDIHQPFGTGRPRDMASWPSMVGRLVRMIGQFVRLALLTRAGVPPAPVVPRVRTPLLERRARAPRLEPWVRFSLFDAGVPAAEPWRAALGYVLAQGDVAALVAVDPRAARLVRSMCRLFGLRPEDVLYPMDPPPIVPEEEPDATDAEEEAAMAVVWAPPAGSDVYERAGPLPESVAERAP